MSHSSEQRSPKRSRSNSRERRRRSSSKDNHVSCLYIGNIDKKVDDDKIQQVFGKYGELEYCYIVYEPTSSHQGNESKLSRGYGFVKFKKLDDSIKAKNELDGLQLYNRRIKVELSKRNRPRQATPGRYLGRKKSPPRQHYRRRSYSRDSSEQYRRRGERKHHRKNLDRDDYKRRQYSRSRQKERQHGYRPRKRSYSYDRQPRR